tara:strand:+ start:1378 stop:2034 length:657 start_codon:yes stop_codon:yes gene_type:complete
LYLAEKKDFMKKNNFLFASIILAAIISACSSNPEVNPKEETEAQVCMFNYDEGTTEFEFTAYKTNAKKGVTGGFNEIEVTFDASNDVKETLESIKFSINTMSVETNDEGRNEKIAKHFFKTINTEVIEGSIKSLGDDGTATIEVSMNGISIDVEGEYTLNGQAFKFESVIDVASWNGMPGIEALNSECDELHKGEDGVSKLWSEVKLSLKTKLKKNCE